VSTRATPGLGPVASRGNVLLRDLDPSIHQYARSSQGGRAGLLVCRLGRGASTARSLLHHEYSASVGSSVRGLGAHCPRSPIDSLVPMTLTTANDVHLTPRSGLSGSLEEAWTAAMARTRAGGQTPDQPAGLFIDLSSVTYFDVPGMVFLLSRLVERSRGEARTSLALPQPSALARLRAWRFDIAYDRLCRPAFSDLLVSESKERWAHVAHTPRTIDDELLPDAYFPLQVAMRVSRPFDPTLAVEWSDEWQRAYILSVLNRMLAQPGRSDRGRRIATHVVHEAIMNGVRHPGASVIASASSARAYRRKDGSLKSKHLSMCVWDDGESIPATLAAVASTGSALVPRSSPLFARRIRLEQVDESQPAKERTRPTVKYVSNLDPVQATGDRDRLLVAATFPGVTSDLSAEHGLAHPEVVSDHASFALPGMGLFVLCSTVAESFGGKVTIRTENLRMSVSCPKSGQPGQDLLVKVTRLPEHASLLGNQLTIRIPTFYDEV
jgi:hypothetical protein